MVSVSVSFCGSSATSRSCTSEGSEEGAESTAVDMMFIKLSGDLCLVRKHLSCFIPREHSKTRTAGMAVADEETALLALADPCVPRGSDCGSSSVRAFPPDVDFVSVSPERPQNRMPTSGQLAFTTDRPESLWT